MSENIIFCFSGTGNCLDIARNVAAVLGDTDIVSLRTGSPAVTDARSAKRVGFVFPCYGGGLPGGLEDTFRKIETAGDAYRFAVCSCSAYPGNGLAMLHAIHPLDYWQVISHQCSCIWLFPHTLMLPPLSPAGAQARSEREAARIGRAVKAMERSKKAPKASALHKAEGKVWKPLSQWSAKRFSVDSMCIGCGTCTKVCPRENIKLAAGKPQYGDDCVQCMGCLQYCPQEAISCGTVTKRREHYHNPNVTASDLTKPIIHIN